MLTRINDSLFTRILSVLFLLGAMVAACYLVAFVPNAHADTSSYLSDLDQAGNNSYAYPNVWTRIGTQICLKQAAGESNYEINLWLVSTTGAGIYTDEADTIIAIAHRDLCPGISI